MNTGDLTFTTIIRPSGQIDEHGATIPEDVLRKAFERLQGKTLAVTSQFVADDVIGVADTFIEIPGIGFAIGGRINKSKFDEAGHQIVEDFDLSMVSVVEDYNQVNDKEV